MQMSNSASSYSTAATVVITTKDRKDELRKALASAFAQTVAVEVLVVDDGSTDGTSDLVQAEFPAARLIRHETSRGLIVRRNEAAKLASGPIIISIDDDAVFSSPHVVEQTLREFDHPQVGAVAIPFINVNQDTILRQRAPDQPGIWITDSYIGTAHAVRRDIFVKLGGYREHLVHQGEEGDYCIRMLAAGYVVRLGTADPIHHFESPRRSFARMDYYGHRNRAKFIWQNVPFPAIVPHTLAAILGDLRTIWCRGRGWNIARGIVAGWTWAVLHACQRQPVPRSIYRLSRQLKKRGPMSLRAAERLLPLFSPLAALGDSLG